MRISWITNCIVSLTIFDFVDLTWDILRLNLTPGCPMDRAPGERCYRSCLANNPELQLAVFTSNNTFPNGAEVTKVLHVQNFDYNNPYSEESTIKIEGNKTIYLHVVLASMDTVYELEHFNYIRRPWFGNLIAVYTTRLIGLVRHRITPYNLIWDQAVESNIKPGELVPHYVSKIYMVGLTGNLSLSTTDISDELNKLYLVNYGPIEDLQVLPIIENDVSKIEREDFFKITGNDTTEVKFEFHWEPVGLGELRMMLKPANKSNAVLFFSEELAYEFKKIYFEGSHNVNLYLFALIFASTTLSTDLLNIYLSRKDKKDKKRNPEIGATLFETVKSIIFCLYFMDVPIHTYALYYALYCLMNPITHLLEHRNDLKSWICNRKAYSVIHSEGHEAERIRSETRKCLEKYLVLPFCLSVAAYSLIYCTHKGWYSWSLQSWANGFYASEFISKLCYIYANYKVKSVEPQSWHKLISISFRSIQYALLAVLLRAPTSFIIVCICDNFITVFAVLQRYFYRSDISRIDSVTKLELSRDTSAANISDSCVDSETNIDEHKEIKNKKEL